MNDKLSEQIAGDTHAPNCHSVTDTDGRCTCYIGRWADEVAALEQKLTRRNDAANNWSRMYEEQKAEKVALEQRVERLERGLRNTVRHYREDNCTDAASCPYLDAAESALAEEEA